ncbi:hypothetical protein VP01_130g5 [Puccinia sorghi]|uniref:Uncharacterized protein n=1 Tax=Puccinia sorghi TaxID=27349 RepID=A0A0L6VNG4_9BASI|nr:hypothetical protein VP01_130g5 [Puccinia sorghi]
MSVASNRHTDTHVDMQKLPESFCCHSDLSPRVIQPSFDAQSLYRLHSDFAKTFTHANRWSLDDSLAGACCNKLKKSCFLHHTFFTLILFFIILAVYFSYHSSTIALPKFSLSTHATSNTDKDESTPDKKSYGNNNHEKKVDPSGETIPLNLEIIHLDLTLVIFVLDEFFLLCQNIFLHLQFDFIFFNLQSILRDLIIFLKYGVTIGDSLDSILRYDGKNGECSGYFFPHQHFSISGATGLLKATPLQRFVGTKPLTAKTKFFSEPTFESSGSVKSDDSTCELIAEESGWYRKKKQNTPFLELSMVTVMSLAIAINVGISTLPLRTYLFFFFLTLTE